MTDMNRNSPTAPAGARVRRRPGSRARASAASLALLLALTAQASAGQQAGTKSPAAGGHDESSGRRAPERQSDDFGYALAVIGDVNGDRVPDLAVGDGSQNRVAVFSGADGRVLHVLDVPTPPQQDDSGLRLAGVEDLNGDGAPDIAVERSGGGPVALFSGVDGVFLFDRESLEPPVDAVAPDASREKRSAERGVRTESELGRVAGDLVIADVNADGVSDLAVAGPSSGQILIYSGANGSPLRSLQLPWAQKETSSLTSALRTCLDRVAYVQAGDWRTLATFWGTSATGYFYFPAGAQIKVRYGVGWFGYDGQKQTLDGLSTRTLSVGFSSVVRARMQMKFGRSVYVNYTICQ